MKRVDAVFVAILNANRNKVLLVNSNGGWGLPGGMREEDETLKQAGEREVMEETGVTVNLGTVGAVTERIKDDQHDLFVTFVTVPRENIDPKVTGDSEVSDIQWFSIEEASAFMPWFPEGLQSVISSSAIYAV